MACNCNGNNTDINSACSGCGGTCDQQLTPGCSTRCGCQTANPTPTPYYLQGGGCQESHDRVVVQNRYAAALSTKSDAIVPACGGTTVLTVDGLVSIPVGAYVWSAVIGGYLKVVSFDYVQGQIVVENDCSVDGGTPGASIPRCSLFIITPPPQTLSSIGPSSLYPFVAVDFTAPANGNCLDITVTNVNGLVVGKNVQIGSGTYRVDSIISATSIRICNDGAGLTPGSVVDAQDSNGNYVVPIILIDASPCTNPEVLTGALVVCKDGIQQPLAAGGVGQVPVVVNATTNEVQFANLDIPSRCCTLLASCINFISETNSYTIFVDANACAFQVGDILMLTDDPRAGRRFEITGIVDGTHYTVTVTPSVDYTETVAAGTQICAADCCEQLAADIQDVYDHLGNVCPAEGGDGINGFVTNSIKPWYNPRVCANELIYNADEDPVATLTPGTDATQYLYPPTTHDSFGWADLRMCNNTCYNQILDITVTYWVNGIVYDTNVAAGKNIVITLQPNYNYAHNGAVYPTCGNGVPARAGYAALSPWWKEGFQTDTDGKNYFTEMVVHTYRHHIAPGNEFLFSCRPNVFLDAAASTSSAAPEAEVMQVGVRMLATTTTTFTDDCLLPT